LPITKNPPVQGDKAEVSYPTGGGDEPVLRVAVEGAGEGTAAP